MKKLLSLFIVLLPIHLYGACEDQYRAKIEELNSKWNVLDLPYENDGPKNISKNMTYTTTLLVLPVPITSVTTGGVISKEVVKREIKSLLKAMKLITDSNNGTYSPIINETIETLLEDKHLIETEKLTSWIVRSNDNNLFCLKEPLGYTEIIDMAKAELN